MQYIWIIGTNCAFALVDLNTATQSELESLSSIGPSKAQAIIEYRKKSGGYKFVDELNEVPGIGSAIMANLRKEITVSGKQKTETTEMGKTEKNKLNNLIVLVFEEQAEGINNFV